MVQKFQNRFGINNELFYFWMAEILPKHYMISCIKVNLFCPFVSYKSSDNQITFCSYMYVLTASLLTVHITASWHLTMTAISAFLSLYFISEKLIQFLWKNEESTGGLAS